MEIVPRLALTVLWLGGLAWPGCGFRIGSMAPSDGAIEGASDSPSDGAIDGISDAAVDASMGSCNGKVWFTDFSTDPTALDLNGDAVPDWALRTAAAFPTAQLIGGVWSTPSSSTPLDTQPKQPFITRVLVHVRMRSITTSGARGAVFWINVGYDGSGTFAPLYVDAKLQSNGTQTLHFMRKTVASVEDEFATITGLGAGFLDVELDIDPATLGVSYLGAGTSGTTTLNRLTSGATDQWATVVAYSGAAEFDEVRVEVCP